MGKNTYTMVSLPLFYDIYSSLGGSKPHFQIKVEIMGEQRYVSRAMGD